MSDTQEAKRWRQRAEEVLGRAADITDEQLRWVMLQVAVGYDHLARRANDAPDALSDVSAPARHARLTNADAGGHQVDNPT
jgi:hypothetical protein